MDKSFQLCRCYNCSGFDFSLLSEHCSVVGGETPGRISQNAPLVAGYLVQGRQGLFGVQAPSIAYYKYILYNCK